MNVITNDTPTVANNNTTAKKLDGIILEKYLKQRTIEIIATIIYTIASWPELDLILKKYKKNFNNVLEKVHAIINISSISILFLLFNCSF